MVGGEGARGVDPGEGGAVADLAERIEIAMTKSVREGKEQSSWSYPNLAYEAGLARFVGGVLDAARPNPFLADFAGFVAMLARPAAIASLAQLVLKLTVPGVPDIYQGGELWDFSLVDPDNRRPVDFALRRRLAEAVCGATPAELARGWQDGREKLFVAARLLGLRRDHPELFISGDYQPLHIGEGGHAHPPCALPPPHADHALALPLPRLVSGLFPGGPPAHRAPTQLA